MLRGRFYTGYAFHQYVRGLQRNFASILGNPRGKLSPGIGQPNLRAFCLSGIFFSCGEIVLPLRRGRKSLFKRILLYRLFIMNPSLRFLIPPNAV